MNFANWRLVGNVTFPTQPHMYRLRAASLWALIVNAVTWNISDLSVQQQSSDVLPSLCTYIYSVGVKSHTCVINICTMHNLKFSKYQSRKHTLVCSNQRRWLCLFCCCFQSLCVIVKSLILSCSTYSSSLPSSQPKPQLRLFAVTVDFISALFQSLMSVFVLFFCLSFCSFFRSTGPGCRNHENLFFLCLSCSVHGVCVFLSVDSHHNTQHCCHFIDKMLVSISKRPKMSNITVNAMEQYYLKKKKRVKSP